MRSHREVRDNVKTVHFSTFFKIIQFDVTYMLWLIFPGAKSRLAGGSETAKQSQANFEF